MQNYLEAVTRVIALMKLPDSPCKNIAVHTAYYTGLFQHLVTENKEFSMDAALEWLGKKKNSICRDAYTAYRKALFRLEHYLLFGDIDSPLCRSEEDFLCRSGMSESFFRLLRELEDYYYLEQNPSYFHTYSVAIKAFFRVATHMGMTEPEAITIEVLLQYEDAYVTVLASDQRQKNAVCAIHTLMKYLHKRGDVPYCYQLVLFNGNSEKLRGMLLSTNGRAFHPSVCLEANAKEYLAALREWNYRDSSLALYQTDFDWYFMFLEINHLEHSKQSVELWSGVLPDYPLQKKANCSPKARRIRTINNFEHFLKGFSTGSTSRERVSVYDALPEWSLTILDGFVESRRLIMVPRIRTTASKNIVNVV